MPAIGPDNILALIRDGIASTPAVERLNRRMASVVATRNIPPNAFFGLELRETFDFLEGPCARASGEDADILLRAFSRPAAEPIVLSFASSGPLCLDVLMRLAGPLCGRPLPLRRSVASAGPDGKGRMIEFLTPGAIEDTYAELMDAVRIGDGDALGPLRRYVGRLLIHPFPDGNGRTARACLNLELAEAFRWPKGCALPLFPHFTHSRRVLQQAFNDAVFDGHEQPLWDKLAAAVMAAGSSRHLSDVAGPGRFVQTAKGKDP